MNKVFIGGSRHVSKLSTPIKERLDNIIAQNFMVFVGDASGADKAVQKYFADASYDRVIVFCSGENYRNNVGHWKIKYIKAANNLKGFQFYALKDREMARQADFGFMIWDGKSAGTILNVLRLVRAGKKAVLFNIQENQFIHFKTANDWGDFISQCSEEFRNHLRERATPDEWPSNRQEQTSFLDTDESSINTSRNSMHTKADDDLAAKINAALASGDPASVVDALGDIARARGMSQVAKDAGLARESLYRSLSTGGNPEFATVLRVMDSVGLRLMVSKVH